jgi:hypothetical protein
MTGWRREVEPDAEAVNCVDASEHHIVNNAGEPRPSQRIPDMNPPSVPMPEPRTSPESEPEQDDRAARLDELLARADQGAQRIVAQQAERHASSDYAARIELEAQAQAEAGQQAQARDELELELLRRSLGAGCGRACCPSGRPPVSRCRTHRPGPGSRGSPSWTRRTGPPGSPQRRESGDLVDLERAVQARRVQQPGPGRTAPVVRSADGLRLLGICGGTSSGSAWKSWIASSLAAASPVSAALKVPCFTA